MHQITPPQTIITHMNPEYYPVIVMEFLQKASELGKFSSPSNTSETSYLAFVEAIQLLGSAGSDHLKLGCLSAQTKNFDSQPNMLLSCIKSPGVRHPDPLNSTPHNTAAKESHRSGPYPVWFGLRFWGPLGHAGASAPSARDWAVVEVLVSRFITAIILPCIIPHMTPFTGV